jgi:cholesterol transport system auxiliary component
MMRYLMLVLLIFLNGCSVLSPINQPEPARYSLMSADTSTTRNQAYGTADDHKGILLVVHMQSDPGFGTSAMIYTQNDSPFELRRYALHAWVSNPSSMIAPQIDQVLTQTGHFKAVVLAPYAGVSDRVLSTRLMSLKQEFNGESSQVYGAIVATVIDSKTHRVIGERVFADKYPAGSNAETGVVAANRVVSDLVQQIARYVVELS